MVTSINDVAFGNLNRGYLSYFNTETYLDSLVEELKNYPFPQNDNEQTKKELDDLIQLTNQLDLPENTERKERYLTYDTNLEGYIISILVNAGVPEAELSETVKDIDTDISPLLIKIKYHYQRTRPLQLAYYIGDLALYPFKSFTSDTPSYPSGHAFHSKIYCEVLGNKYPKFYKQLQELAEDIAWSRLYMGANFGSGCDFGTYMAEIVLKHPDFKKKYRL